MHDAPFFDTFKQVMITNENLCLLGVGEFELAKIHRYLATFTFHAYSGFRWSDIFDKIKDSSDDKSNIAMRQLIQTTGSADGSNSKTSNGTTQKKKRGQLRFLPPAS